MRRRRSYSRLSYGDDYGYWPKAPTVSERKANTARESAKLVKKGDTLSPVRIQGRTIARTFWGKAWCTNLEGYSDYSNRLPRGRSYLSSGQVLDLRIEKGRVVARVMGTRLYTVTVSIDPVPHDHWKSIVRSCAGQVGSMIELLQGKLSTSVMETVTRPRTGLFPAPSEIHLKCSCPDWATMCKHVAASLYGVGARLDESPELLFLLRGVDPKDLVVNAGAARAITGQAKDKALGADTSELADLFGIDMDDAVEEAAAPANTKPTVPTSTRPAATKSVAAKPKPRKMPALPRATRASTVPANVLRSSSKLARANEGTLVAQKDLDGRGIDQTILDYWVSAGLLSPGPKKGTWLATPEAMRRIERCPRKLPLRRKRR